MRVVRLVFPILGVVLFAAGASCDEAKPEPTGDPSSEKPPSRPAPEIRTLPGVDLSPLGSAGKEQWAGVVNELLSPCGDPVSVARCVEEERRCRECLHAARYVARLVGEGYEDREIEELFQYRYDDKAKVELHFEGAPVRGSELAPVTIVEFSDFECPYCGAAHPILRELIGELDGKAKLVFKHYPLPAHPHAREAARAAIAARNQGKFWEMHDLLFENQKELERSHLKGYAESLGLDMAQFVADMDAEATERVIEADRAEGKKVGVLGTPTLFVNGRRFEEPHKSLVNYVREELDR